MTQAPRTGRTVAPAPAPRPRIKQAGPAPLRVMVALLSALVLVVTGVGYQLAGNVSNSAGELDLGGGSKVAKQRRALDGATDILLVGVDSRSDAQGNPLTQQEIDMLHAGDEMGSENTDTIMIIRIPNDGSSATAISIPRDTYVHVPDYGNMKINSVYAAYRNNERQELAASGMTDERKIEKESAEVGRRGLVQAISQLTGVTVDHYAEVGLLGFVLLTDAVGGVQVCLNEAVQDEFSGANFPAGVQTLNGPAALAYVRQRHGLPRGDLDRIVRQQTYMASLVRSVLSSNTLSSPSKLGDLAGAARRSLTIDDDWDIMGFATQLSNLTGGNVKFETIPVISIDGVGDYGESVVTVDVNQVHDFFSALAVAAPTSSETPTTGTDGQLKKEVDTSLVVHVLNASTTQGLASRVGAALGTIGYPVGDIGNAPAGMYAESQVLARDPQDPEVKALARRLGNLTINQTGSLEDGEAVVVVSTDYTGPTAEPTAEPGTETVPNIVGEPGMASDPIDSPVIDAGGNGPRCVN